MFLFSLLGSVWVENRAYQEGGGYKLEHEVGPGSQTESLAYEIKDFYMK